MNEIMKYKTSSIKAAEKDCGVSRGRPQHGEFSGGIRMDKKAITEKRKSVWRWKQFLSGENKSLYVSDKKKAKRVVAEAMKRR